MLANLGCMLHGGDYRLHAFANALFLNTSSLFLPRLLLTSLTNNLLTIQSNTRL